MSQDFILKPNKGSLHKKKRLGAGPGSGLGSTCGRGHDGQRSRSGKKRPYVGFEGGQMPLYRRIPKRGFFKAKGPVLCLNLSDLERFPNDAKIDIAYFLDEKMVKNPQTKLIVLAKGQLTKKLVVCAHRISVVAKSKIESLGGIVEILERI